jgi:hypothetical protein
MISSLPIPEGVEGYRVGNRVMIPPLGPGELWHRLDVRRALAVHDFSTLFKIMRRYGIPQRRIAVVLECSQSEISEILAGRMVRQYPVLVRYSEGLGVPRSWLGLAYDPETLRLLEATGGAASST